MGKPPPVSIPWQIPDLDRRPVIVVLAGPNGAGKTTFYESHLKNSGLRFLNADILAGELGLEAYPAAEVTAKLRQEFLRQRESFVFETVLSDPEGEKVLFLEQAARSGYSVVMCFIGLAGAERSEERVAMRVSQGGHDVPTDKLIKRFPRTLANLKRAIRQLPCVLVFDNNDLRAPYRLAVVFQNGRQTLLKSPSPNWLETLI